MVAMNNVGAGNAKYQNNNRVPLLPSGLHMMRGQENSKCVQLRRRRVKYVSSSCCDFAGREVLLSLCCGSARCVQSEDTVMTIRIALSGFSRSRAIWL